MKRERTPQPVESRAREVRVSSRPDDDIAAVAHDAALDGDLDGQLGPDEMPDADEVVMNREAKLHRG